MGLSGALQLGRSGLLTSQAALQVTGHNLANIATPGYHRQTVALAPAGSTKLHGNAYLGRGVRIDSVTRVIDEALEGRLRAAVADQSHSTTRQQLLSQIEAIENELSGSGLSSRLTEFFNSWSQLANNPQDISLRTLVTEQGATLASFVQDLRHGLTDLRTRIETTAGDTARQVNSLLEQIEQLNQRITLAGGGESSSSTAAGLKDQRDALLGKLAEYMDISTVTHESGVTDIFVGSLPIILDGKSRGVELRTETQNGETTIDLVIADDQSPLDVSSGRLGALVQFRQQDLHEAISTLDTFAHQLIWQVNRVHSQGQGLGGQTSITGQAQAADPTAALNSAAADLAFPPAHGSFQVHLTQKSTGQRVTTTIQVDLDGINPAGDTTLASLAADLNAVGNLTATVTADGRLQLDAASDDYAISFSDDSSGALAALGVNTYFTGEDAATIAVSATIAADPALLAAAQDHLLGDNRNALALSGLRERGVESLDGQSLTDFWNRHVEAFAVRAAQAKQEVEADTVVRQNLQQKQQQLSGVNPDEETINLLQQQRAYQASARFISVVDELMTTLLNMV